MYSSGDIVTVVHYRFMVGLEYFITSDCEDRHVDELV